MIYTPEENMIITLEYYTKLIERKKDEAEGYKDYFINVEPNRLMNMYAKGKIDAYKEIIEILKERD